MSDYQNQIEQHNQAYQAHLQMYSIRNPPPLLVPYEEIEPKPTKGEVVRANTIAKIGLALMTVASVIISASRTIPEFGGWPLGFIATGMLELGALVYTFLHSRIGYGKEQHERVKRYIAVGFGLAIFIALAANIHYEAGKAILDVLGKDASTFINSFIVLLVAISAPILTYINGHVLAMLTAKDEADLKIAQGFYDTQAAEWRERRDSHHAAFRQQTEVWRAGLNTAWSQQKGRLIKVEREPEAPKKELPAPSGGIPNKAEFIRKLLGDRPELMDMGPRPLHRYIVENYPQANVSKSLVDSVLKSMRGDTDNETG